jgi:hypothetical protein
VTAPCIKPCPVSSTQLLWIAEEAGNDILHMPNRHVDMKTQSKDFANV